MREAKRFAGVCLTLSFLAATGHLIARQMEVEQPSAGSDETQHATSALIETAIPPEALQTRRDQGERTRCAKIEIEEGGSIVFRAQCPVGKTRCPWISLAKDEARVSGGYLPAQTFPVGPDTKMTCEEIMDDGSLVLRSLLPEPSNGEVAESDQAPEEF